MKSDAWTTAQIWESGWWGDCTNTFWEETKQMTYARLMGLEPEFDNETGRLPTYDLHQATVLDIGAGPVSLLLKCKNGKMCGYDPCYYPAWVYHRYGAAHITFFKKKAEDIPDNWIVDEVWIYNVLTHVENPKIIIDKALRISKIVRLFEWLNTPVCNGHLQTLNQKQMDEWLKGTGKVQPLNENGCTGLSYSGIFLGAHYGKVQVSPTNTSSSTSIKGVFELRVYAEEP